MKNRMNCNSFSPSGRFTLFALAILASIPISACNTTNSNNIANNSQSTSSVNAPSVAEDQTLDTKAAKELNAEGLLLTKGLPSEEDDAKAFKLFQLAANQGLLDAQNNLGLMYAHGRGVSQNDNEAAHWFTIAADAGYPPAMSNLGLMTLAGIGVKEDKARAIDLFQRASDLGDPAALNNLGVMYRDGIVVPQSPETAAKLFESATKRGYAVAYINLAKLYMDGIGVEQDRDRAVSLLNDAATLGNPEAQRILDNEMTAPNNNNEIVSNTKSDNFSENDDNAQKPCRLKGEIIMSTVSACRSMAGEPML